MSKHRVGAQIVSQRPEDSNRNVFSKGDRFLPPEIGDRLLDHLRREPSIELIEDLDYKAATVVDDQVHVGEVCLNDLDAYVWYTVQDPVVPCFGLDVLEVLSESTTVIPNPVRFATGLDKFRSHFTLKRAGADVANFMLFDHRNIAKAQEVLVEWGAGLFKPRRGNFGMGVTLVNDPDQLRDLTDYVFELAGGHSPDAGFLMERFYANDPALWTSVVVANGQVEYGYRKLPSKHTSMGHGAVKIYDAGKIGGAVNVVGVNRIQQVQAEKAAAALGLPLVSLDMIDHHGRPIIIDENTYPGCYPQLLADNGEAMALHLFENLMGELTMDRTHALGRGSVPQGDCARLPLLPEMGLQRLPSR